MASDGPSPLEGAADEDPGTPRWVKVFFIVGLLIAALVLVLLLSGRAHGPGQHFSSVDRPLTSSGSS
jgi:hypothetical protein